MSLVRKFRKQVFYPNDIYMFFRPLIQLQMFAGNPGILQNFAQLGNNRLFSNENQGAEMVANKCNG